MTEDQRLDLIKLEYLKLQDFYEDFDKRIQTIKNWSITVALVSIGTGIHQKNEYLGLFACLAALIFWIIETIWKIFQYCYRDRIVEIETNIRNNSVEKVVPLQIYTSWFEAFQNPNLTFSRIFFMSIVFLPHLPIIILGIIFFVCQHFGFINFFSNY